MKFDFCNYWGRRLKTFILIDVAYFGYIGEAVRFDDDFYKNSVRIVLFNFEVEIFFSKLRE